MKKYLAPFFLMLLFMARFACGQVPVPDATPSATVDVWPEGKMPGQGAKEPESKVQKSDGLHRITNVSRPTLSMFPSAKGGAAAPAMIVCPGGGYSYVVTDKEGSEIAAWLNSQGIKVSHEFLCYPTGGHGYGLHCNREARAWPQAAFEWLHKIGVTAHAP